jgi:acetolactate synthase-1/2/3 large subunit
VKMIRTAMAAAFRLASTGRKGPTHVEIPPRVLNSEAQLKSDFSHPHLQAKINRNDINAAHRIIRDAKQPVIFAGDHVLRYLAHSELLELAETIQAPVVVSDNCLDAFPHDHPLFAGSLPANFDGQYLNPIAVSAIKRADLIMLIGAHLQNPETSLILSLGRFKCGYIGPERLHLRGSKRLQVSLIGNIKHYLAALIQLAKSSSQKKMNPSLAEQLAQQKKVVAEAFQSVIADKADSRPIHPGFVASTVRGVSDRNAIITTDVGSHAIWVRDYFKAYEPLTYLETGNYGSMGFALPAAIAAKIVKPDQQVIAITGDGGLLMSVMELTTAVEYKANIMLVVMNDSKYGMIWQAQNLWYEGRHIGVDLVHSDFAAVAQGFGVHGIRVEDPNNLTSALKEGLSSHNVTVVDVLVDHRPDYPSRTIFKRAPG